MNKKLLLLVFSIVFWAGCSKTIAVEKDPPVIEIPVQQEPSALVQKLLKAKWKINQVSDEIIVKYHHFNDLFNSKQSITVIEVNLNKDVIVDIPYVTSGFLKTSDAALATNAYAAINGSYFDTKVGGSTTFFKKDGKIITPTREGYTKYREDAGFSITSSGQVTIVKKPEDGWQKLVTNSLLVSGPLLVNAGKPVEQVVAPFNTNRHPRTAVGVTGDNRLIAVVVDGRASEAHGMSTTELAALMDALGCKEAMNLDGGGSSTAWAKNQGIINFPTDNKKFDHEGERGVATVITFKSK